MRYKKLKDAPLDQRIHTPEMGIAPFMSENMITLIMVSIGLVFFNAMIFYEITTITLKIIRKFRLIGHALMFFWVSAKWPCHDWVVHYDHLFFNSKIMGYAWYFR